MAWWTVSLEETTAPSKTLMTSLNGLRPPLAFRWENCFTRLDNSTDTLPPDAGAWGGGPGGAGRVSHRGDQLPLAGRPPQLCPGGVRIQPFRWELTYYVSSYFITYNPSLRWGDCHDRELCRVLASAARSQQLGGIIFDQDSFHQEHIWKFWTFTYLTPWIY